MVKHLNIAIDDDLHDRASEIKDAREWTWEEFLEQATAEFED